MLKFKSTRDIWRFKQKEEETLNLTTNKSKKICIGSLFFKIISQTWFI